MVYRIVHVSADHVWQAALDTWMFLVRATAAAQVSPWEDDAAELVRGVVDQVVGLVAGDPSHQRQQERHLQRPHLFFLPRVRFTDVHATRHLRSAVIAYVLLDLLSRADQCGIPSWVETASNPGTFFQAVPVGFRV